MSSYCCPMNISSPLSSHPLDTRKLFSSSSIVGFNADKVSVSFLYDGPNSQQRKWNRSFTQKSVFPSDCFAFRNISSLGALHLTRRRRWIDRLNNVIKWNVYEQERVFLGCELIFGQRRFDWNSLRFLSPHKLLSDGGELVDVRTLLSVGWGCDVTNDWID